jgi:uncharacterized membrane protein
MIPRGVRETWVKNHKTLVNTGFVLAAALGLAGAFGLAVGLLLLTRGPESWLYGLASMAVGAVAIALCFFLNAVSRVLAAIFDIVLETHDQLDQREQERL